MPNSIKPTVYNIPCIMTRKELQEILKISKSTTLELLREEKISSFKIKGRYRITRDALMEYLEHQM